MTTIRLPGLIDAHVHLREPGYTYKEDFYTGTAAALAGGVTALLDMPNTQPPTSTPDRFYEKVKLAAEKVVCDVGLFAGATSTELDAYLPVAPHACGLKIYVSETFGSLRIEDLSLMHRFFRTWAERADTVGYRSVENPGGLGPIAVHAEDLMAAVCINLSHLYNVPLHIVHVSRRSEIELIRRAKERDVPVTCEATPHHLFISTEDLPRLGARGDMRPRISTPDDVASLWENLDVIDIFATDHAPHTSVEKGFGDANAKAGQGDVTHPPGIPGVETMLPLLLTAVHEDRLTVDDITERCVTAPRRIYGVPEQPDTYIEVDVDAQYTLRDEEMKSKVGWTTFDGQSVFGRVEKVVLRDKVVFEDGEVLAEKGSGQVLFL